MFPEKDCIAGEDVGAPATSRAESNKEAENSSSFLSPAEPRLFCILCIHAKMIDTVPNPGDVTISWEDKSYIETTQISVLNCVVL